MRSRGRQLGTGPLSIEDLAADFVEDDVGHRDWRYNLRQLRDKAELEPRVRRWLRKGHHDARLTRDVSRLLRDWLAHAYDPWV